MVVHTAAGYPHDTKPLALRPRGVVFIGDGGMQIESYMPLVSAVKAAMDAALGSGSDCELEVQVSSRSVEPRCKQACNQTGSL